MSDMPPVSEEVVVYGNAPEGSSGGGTDTISIPVDFLTFYAPTGPTIVNLPPPNGGGGGDLGDPKEHLEEAEDKATWIAVGFTIIAMTPGVGEFAVAVAGTMAVVFGVTAHIVGDDPPQPNYKRAAGSTVPRRSLALTGPPRVDRAVEKLLDVERTCAVFIDAIECAQGAFLAADAPWTQRHTEAARDAYREFGQALLAAVDPLREVAGQLRSAGPQPGPQPDVAAGLPALLARVRPVLGLSADDEAHVTDQILPAASRGLPTDAEIKSAVETFRQLGRRLADPIMIDARFAWPVPESVRSGDSISGA
jgi:hypothetical protein